MSSENDPQRRYNQASVFKAPRRFALYWNDPEKTAVVRPRLHPKRVVCFSRSVWSNMWLWPSLATSTRRSVSSHRPGKTGQQVAPMHVLIVSGFIIWDWAPAKGPPLVINSKGSLTIFSPSFCLLLFVAFHLQYLSSILQDVFSLVLA